MRDPAILVIIALIALLFAAGGYLSHTEAKLYDATHTTVTCGGVRAEVELSTREAASWAARHCAQEGFEIHK